MCRTPLSNKSSLFSYCIYARKYLFCQFYRDRPRLLQQRNSITSFIFVDPLRTVPVIIVPLPLILKQWSTEKRNGPASSLLGTNVIALNVSISLSIFSIDCGSSATFATPSTSPWPSICCLLAATATTGLSANLVLSSVFHRRLLILSTALWRFDSSIRSSLFRTISSRSQQISPMMRHSAVWVWTPLTMSMTSIIMSMIWAPPIMVFISEAWPGQSTKVYCTNL